jgi:DNA-binding HxlR family transcriptional regulator
MAKRTYGQYCAVARTLDIVGERWTLLIVRELLGGARRYSDILEALPGIGTSLLAQRLKDLEDENLISRKRLAPPAASTVYELTDVGEELARALVPLALWGAKYRLGPRKRGETFRTEWPLHIFRALLEGPLVAGIHAVYEFRVDDSVAHLLIDDGRVLVRDGPAPGPVDVTLTTDTKTFVDMGVRRIDPARAVAEGLVTVEGDPDAVLRFGALTESAFAEVL